MTRCSVHNSPMRKSFVLNLQTECLEWPDTRVVTSLVPIDHSQLPAEQINPKIDELFAPNKQHRKCAGSRVPAQTTELNNEWNTWTPSYGPANDLSAAPIVMQDNRKIPGTERKAHASTIA